MKNKKQYIAPEFTVVSFKIEMGFQTSGGENVGKSFGLFQLNQDYNSNYNDQFQEKWEPWASGESSGNLFDSW